MNNLSYIDFLKTDIRVGTIIKAEENHKLKNPSMILEIDFGQEIGIKKSSAQLLSNYNIDIVFLMEPRSVIYSPDEI